MPVSGTLTVYVYEWDLIGDDLIGTISWPPPYGPAGSSLSAGRARYRVSVIA